MELSRPHEALRINEGSLSLQPGAQQFSAWMQQQYITLGLGLEYKH